MVTNEALNKDGQLVSDGFLPDQRLECRPQKVISLSTRHVPMCGFFHVRYGLWPMVRRKAVFGRYA
eukprot:2755301-Prymnesium_polylepis.1